MSPLFTGIHHIGLRVADVAAVANFYAATASFSPWQAAQSLQWPGAGRLLHNANGGLALLPTAPGQAPVRVPVCEAGITHVCLQTPAITTVHGAMGQAGGSFHCNPIDLGTGFLYCYARDREFNVIEVEGVAPVWQDPTPWLAHVNIATADLERAIAFYNALLGQTATRSPRLRNDSRLDAIADLAHAELRIAWLPVGNMQIELMQYFAPATTFKTPRHLPGVCGYAHIAFEVTNLPAAVAHCVASGGTSQWLSGNDWLAPCQDPDGNSIWLVDLTQPIRQGASLAYLPEPLINQRFNTSRAALLTTA